MAFEMHILVRISTRPVRKNGGEEWNGTKKVQGKRETDREERKIRTPRATVLR